MKTNLICWVLAAASVSCGFSVNAADAPGPNNSNPGQRIGIYDSRVIAYAHFWSEPQQKLRSEAYAEGKEAKAGGDSNRLARVKERMKTLQEKSHLQVFSTAPVNDELAEIKEHVERVKSEAKVARLVSKWDKAELTKHPSAEQIDVTDKLLAAFKLDEKQYKIAAQLRTKDPLSLEDAKRLIREGKL